MADLTDDEEVAAKLWSTLLGTLNVTAEQLFEQAGLDPAIVALPDAPRRAAIQRPDTLLRLAKVAICNAIASEVHATQLRGCADLLVQGASEAAERDAAVQWLIDSASGSPDDVSYN